MGVWVSGCLGCLGVWCLCVWVSGCLYRLCRGAHTPSKAGLGVLVSGCLGVWVWVCVWGGGGVVCVWGGCLWVGVCVLCTCVSVCGICGIKNDVLLAGLDPAVLGLEVPRVSNCATGALRRRVYIPVDLRVGPGHDRRAKLSAGM